jgi:hypothetical protein
MSSSMTRLVDRKLEIQKGQEIGDPMSQGQTTADFFSVADRRELLKQGVLLEQILRDIGDVRITAKEDLKQNTIAVEAHEKRIRVLEDAKLELKTKIDTSWRWIVLLSAFASGLVSYAVRLIGK